MPALALALPLAAVIVRMLKEALTEAMLQDYVLLARIKGCRSCGSCCGEALRNAVGPTLALTGVQFTFLIGGTVIVERIFAYPGIGNLAIDAVINRDLPLIQGLVLLFGLIFILINLAVDLAVVALNPDSAMAERRGVEHWAPTASATRRRPGRRRLRSRLRAIPRSCSPAGSSSS